MGKVRFSYFDTHVQGTKKLLLATENNIFAALNTRTGDLCEYSVLYLLVVILPPKNIKLLIGYLCNFLVVVVFFSKFKCFSLATCG